MALGHGEGGAPAEDMSALEVPSVSVVCLASLVMVLVAGLGGIPFFFVERMSNWCHGVANAFAMGVMLACSFDLLRDGQKWSSWQPLTGLLAGATLVKACQRALEGREAVALQALSKGMTTRKSLLLLGTMALHSFGEGAGVGAAFCGSSGVLTSIAMGIHNIPEGLAVAAVLFSEGESPGRCVLWAVLTSLPQAIASVLSFAFIGSFGFITPGAMGFAAGCMLYLALSEMVADATRMAGHESVGACSVASIVGLEAFRMWGASFSFPDFAWTALAERLRSASVASVPTNLIPASALAMASAVPLTRKGRLPQAWKAFMAWGVSFHLAFLSVLSAVLPSPSIGSFLFPSLGALVHRAARAAFASNQPEQSAASSPKAQNDVEQMHARTRRLNAGDDIAGLGGEGRGQFSASVVVQHVAALSLLAFFDGCGHAEQALSGRRGMGTLAMAAVRAVPKGVVIAWSAFCSGLTKRRGFVMASLCSAIEQVGALIFAAGCINNCPRVAFLMALGACASLASCDLAPAAFSGNRSARGAVAGCSLAALSVLVTGRSACMPPGR